MLLAILSPLGWIFALMSQHDTADEECQQHGRNVVVPTPLRCCEHCAANEKLSSNFKQLKRFLRAVPEYDALLNEYPDAELVLLDAARMRAAAMQRFN